MTRICGIIAEYDPLHNGHAWHLAEARKITRADVIVCMMSMYFTQRGMPALLSPHERAKMALRAGADIVLGLPVSFSLCDGERFAAGGVSILRLLGAQALSFGAEPEGIPWIEPAAALLEKPTEAFQAAFRALLDRGLSFPKAQGDALAQSLKADPSLFSLPNTALSICYARANMRQHAGLALYPIPRRGDYLATELPEDQRALPSATAVRAAALKGDWQSVRRSMPESAYLALKQGFDAGKVHLPEALTPLLRWALRNEGKILSLPDLSEGIENRFAAAANCLDRSEMVLTIKSKRYPYARISRLLSNLLLGTDRSQLQPLPSHAYLLAARKEHTALLRQLQSDDFHLHTSLNSSCTAYEEQLDARAEALWSLGAGQPFGAIYREKPFIV